MRHTSLFIAVITVILSTTPSCKKCYTCTLPNECGSCDHAGAQGAYMCSSVVPQQYAQAKANCQANGDYWRIYSTANNLEDHCKNKPDNTWLTEQQRNCESAGGIWQ